MKRQSPACHVPPTNRRSVQYRENRLVAGKSRTERQHGGANHGSARTGPKHKIDSGWGSCLVWLNQTGPQVQVVQRSPTNGAACHNRVLAGKVNTERHSQVAGVVNWNIYPKYGREVKMDDESRWWTPRNIQAKMYCCTVFFYNISKMRFFFFFFS